ncbi:variable surface protein [Plasmodium gonderi]|uniref:Variable surface protein n=1 Tax=Plasmodium gonderi TaxID=77519 RepID=A0A1Y1JQT7_PLAGO|nr:variable surface protein [Plasmodium gonderi]GAW84590.1 variable surface protein [Plasmodium gonderi]
MKPLNVLHMLINYFDLSTLPSQRLYRNINDGYYVINEDNFWDEIEYRIRKQSDIPISKKLISGFTYGAYGIKNVEEKDEIWNFLYFWTGEIICITQSNFIDVMKILTEVIYKFDVQNVFIRDLLSITNKDDFSKLKMIFDYIYDYEIAKSTITQNHVVCSTQLNDRLNNYFMNYIEVKNKCDSDYDTLCQIFKKFMEIKQNNGNLEKLTCRAVSDKEIKVKEDEGFPKTAQGDLTLNHVIILKNTEEGSDLQPSIEVGYHIESEDHIVPETPAGSEPVSGLNQPASDSADDRLEQDSGVEPDAEFKLNGKFKRGDVFEQADGFESHDNLETSTVSPEDTILQKPAEHPGSAVTPKLTQSQESNGLSESGASPKLTELSDVDELPDIVEMPEINVSHQPNVVPGSTLLQVPATPDPVGSPVNPAVNQNGQNNPIKTSNSPNVKPLPGMNSFFSSTYTKAGVILLFLGILIPMLIVYTLSVLISKVQSRYFRKKKNPYHMYFDKTHVYPFYYDRMLEGKSYHKQNYVGYYPLMIE